jgi:hypothetical protein
MKFRNAIIATVGSALILASSLTMGAAQTVEDVDGDATVEITRKDNLNSISVWITDSDFDAHPYSLVEQPVPGNLTIGLDDFRGTADGWDVYISATEFTSDNGRSFGAEQLVLDPGDFDLNPDVTQENVTTDGQSTTASVQLSSDSQGIWSAANGNGAGHFVLPVDGTLTIPGGTLVGTYTSTMTVSVEAGPGGE